MTRGIIDEKRALEHLMALLAIEGLSGQEKNIAAEVKRRARAAGCRPAWIRHDDAHRRIGEGYQVGNLIIRLPGTVKAPRRLLASHLDTVPLCRGAQPIRRGKRIVSKGATGLGGDNRTAVACLVTVLEQIVLNNLPHPPLTFLFTVGEEVGLKGASKIRLADLGRPRLGFNIDGGDPAEMWIGALGADRWVADIQGVSSHAGVHPDHGVSATLIASRAIADVAAQGFFGKIVMGKRRGTSNVGVIRGGEATNQVTDHIYIKGESRSHDETFVTKITEVYRKAFDRAARGVRNHKRQTGKVRFHASQDYRPFRLERDADVVRLAREAARSVGLKPRLGYADGGLDANHLNRKGLPTVTLGAGQHSPHTVGEYIEISEYLDGCRLALGVASHMG